MLVLQRETLVSLLQEVGGLGGAKGAARAQFIEHLDEWLVKLETELARFRSPLVSAIASARARLASIADGYLPEQVEKTGLRTPRRMRHAAAASLLDAVEHDIRQEVAALDKTLDAHRTDMARLVAVSLIGQPRPERRERPRSEWLTEVWSELARSDEARGMHAYLRASLTRADRHELLAEILERMDD